MVRSLFKHSGMYFIGSLISKAITTIAWISIARVLTPEKYGQFTLYFIILQIVTFIGDFGLNQYYLKHVDEIGRKILFNKILQVRTVTLLITAFISASILFYFKIFDRLTSFVLIVSLIPMSFLSISEGYFLKEKKSLRVSLKLTSIGGIFLIGYALFFQSLDLIKTILILLVSLTISLIWFFPWREINVKKLIILSETISILSSSSSYAYLTFTSFLYNRGDSFIISYFKGVRELGIYGLAYRFLESLSLFSSSITQNLFPISAKKNGITVRELFKITSIMACLGIFFSLCVYFAAPFLIVGLFGLQYSAGVTILQIFSIVLFLFFLNAPLATVVQSSKLVKAFLPFGILNTLSNIFLNILLIPLYGISVAAWIMVLTELTGLVINFYFVRKLYSQTN